MKSVIIGTAGHIDHGKTALVKVLTGIDADRLEEEKRRGITIDLGFAHLELPGPGGDTIRFGFVDVPGHERFIRNMLAGVGGIDVVLFVIAADESIKPQTREHFDICRLLSIPRGITVLTKSDLVDNETLNVVKMEVEEFLRGSFLDASRATIIPVSSLAGAGLEQLRKALINAAIAAPTKDSASLARLPIDRVFTMKGFGTVVTGTLISGSIGKEQELELFPKGKRVRVRGVQVYGQSADQAAAGQRTALNVAGIDKDELARGMMLAPPATFNATYRADVELALLPSAKPLRNRARVHLHVYTSETTAEVVLYAGKQIAPGERAFVQLRLTDPLLLLPGDRFIVRQFSPVITIGGGSVLDASPLRKTPKDGHESYLQVLAANSPQTVLKVRVARRTDQGLSLAQAIAETGWRKEFVEYQLEGSVKAGHIMRVGERFFSAGVVEGLKLFLLGTVGDFHQQNPLVPGTGKEALRESINLDAEIFEAVVAILIAEKKIVIAGDLIHLPGRGVEMKDEESESRTAIENAFASAGLAVPALKDVLASLRVDKVRAQKIVTLLLREKTLMKIADDLVFHRATLEDLRQRVVRHKTKSAKLDVAQFKDLTGVSRKYAIPLLEYLDREHVTKRVGNERIIL
jgi:selenocysteine-specific elongation factor